MPLVSFTRATLRSAEFGFFGVVVYTRVHTPRRCGLPLRAAVFCLATLSWRPLRTSCWIVGIDRLSFSRSLFWPCAPPLPVTRGRACRPTSGSRVGLNQPRRGSGGTVDVPHRHTDRPDMGRAQVAKIPGAATRGQNGVRLRPRPSLAADLYDA